MTVTPVFMLALLNVSEPALVAAAVINLVLCGAIAWASACRVAKTSRRTTRGTYRALYAASGACAFMAAWSWPWVGPLWHLGLLGCYVWAFTLGSVAWQRGPPPEARKPSLTPTSTKEPKPWKPWKP
ncbi:MAG: hypothetical protein ACRCYZ_06815 [Alphaproteobacteria bacterium]